MTYQKVNIIMVISFTNVISSSFQYPVERIDFHSCFTRKMSTTVLSYKSTKWNLKVTEPRIDGLCTVDRDNDPEHYKVYWEADQLLWSCTRPIGDFRSPSILRNTKSFLYILVFISDEKYCFIFFHLTVRFYSLLSSKFHLISFTGCRSCPAIISAISPFLTELVAWNILVHSHLGLYLDISWQARYGKVLYKKRDLEICSAVWQLVDNEFFHAIRKEIASDFSY